MARVYDTYSYARTQLLLRLVLLSLRPQRPPLLEQVHVECLLWVERSEGAMCTLNRRVRVIRGSPKEGGIVTWSLQ